MIPVDRLAEIRPRGTVTLPFGFVAWFFGIQVPLGAKGFVFARPSVGTAFSASTQFAFLEATAGLAQSVDLATATHQVSDTAYASGFKLEGQIDIGPGKDLTSAIDKLGDLLGVDLDLDLTLVDLDETLAESPKGSFTITPASVQPGDSTALGDLATFTVELDPVTYLGLETVDHVEIFWKKDDGNDGFTLDPGRPGCTDISGSAGQTNFTCETDFLDEHGGEQTSAQNSMTWPAPFQSRRRPRYRHNKARTSRIDGATTSGSFPTTPL